MFVRCLLAVLTPALTAVALQAAEPSTAPVEGLRDNTPQYHALVGGKVVTAPGRIIENATIVIRDGIITSVGVNVAVPRGAAVWDAIDRTIYAGFIDAYAE